MTSTLWDDPQLASRPVVARLMLFLGTRRALRRTRSGRSPYGTLQCTAPYGSSRKPPRAPPLFPPPTACFRLPHTRSRPCLGPFRGWFRLSACSAAGALAACCSLTAILRRIGHGCRVLRKAPPWRRAVSMRAIRLHGEFLRGLAAVLDAAH